MADAFPVIGQHTWRVHALGAVILIQGDLAEVTPSGALRVGNKDGKTFGLYPAGGWASCHMADVLTGEPYAVSVWHPVNLDAEAPQPDA